VIGNTVLFHQGDEIERRVARQCGFGEMGVLERPFPMSVACYYRLPPALAPPPSYSIRQPCPGLFWGCVFRQTKSARRRSRVRSDPAGSSRYGFFTRAAAGRHRGLNCSQNRGIARIVNVDCERRGLGGYLPIPRFPLAVLSSANRHRESAKQQHQSHDKGHKQPSFPLQLECPGPHPEFSF
jgi:hypothetical protein